MIGSVVDQKGRKLKMKKPKIFHEVDDDIANEMDHMTNVTPKYTPGDAAYLFYHGFDYK